MTPQTEKEDKMLLALAEDRLSECQSSCIMTHTSFLDSRQCALVGGHVKKLGASFELFGGYDDAERRIAVFLPDYMDSGSLSGEDSPLSVLHIEVPKGSKPLTHRDYLGSLLALGIKREVIGDIIAGENCADVIILKEMEDFLLTNYSRAGKAFLTCKVLPVSAISRLEPKTAEIRDTLASIRLDALCASAFRLSRGKAQEAIAAGLVSVNGMQCLKPDFSPQEGDRFSLRGSGKAVLFEIGGQSRKGRLYVVIKKFL